MKFALAISMVGALLAWANPGNAETRAECVRWANMSYFLTVDRALLSFEQAKKSCHDHITTVDRLLECIQRAEAKKDEALREAARRRNRALARCRRL